MTKTVTTKNYLSSFVQKLINELKLFQLNSEQELLKQCQKGDRQSQMTLYKKYARAMYQVSRNIIKDEMKAEEAMQDAFLSAFEKRGTYSRSNFWFLAEENCNQQITGLPQKGENVSECRIGR